MYFVRKKLLSEQYDQKFIPIPSLAKLDYLENIIRLIRPNH